MFDIILNMEKQNDNSYGAIPILKKEKDFYILCVKNTKSGQWGLPKGTPEEGETPIQTAMRELEEETGVIKIGLVDNIVFKESYVFERDNVEHYKTNTYFIGFVKDFLVGSDLDGVDEIRWVNIKEVNGVLKFESLLKLVKELEDYLNTLNNES